MKANVQITASKKVLENGQQGYEVKVEGMEGKLQCVKNFKEENALGCMRYMFLLAKRLELHINSIDLAAVSLAYRRAKEAEQKAVEEANAVLAAADEAEAEPAQAEASKDQPVEEPAPASSLLEQYNKLKEANPEAVLLFRVGDFYIGYAEDSQVLADVLGITRISHNGHYEAAFPHHALDAYLPRLIRSGHRVAICDEEAPAPAAKRRGRPKKKA